MNANKDRERLMMPNEGIDWDLQAACNDCPFMKSTLPHEGVCASLPDYVESIEAGHFAHTCHKTDNRDDVDGPRNYRGEKPKHCYGALMMLLKTGNGKDLQMPLLQAMEAGKFDIAALTRKAEVDSNAFTVSELLKFYAHYALKLIRKRRRKELRRKL